MAKVAKKLAALQVKADKVSAEIELLSAEVKKAAAAPAEKSATATPLAAPTRSGKGVSTSKMTLTKKAPIAKTATKKTPGRKPAMKKTSASTTSTIAK